MIGASSAAPGAEKVGERVLNVLAGVSPRPSLGELSDRLRAAGLGLAMLVLGIATLVPGVAFLFGGALAVVGAAHALGRDGLWLPQALRRRRVDRDALRDACLRFLPMLSPLTRWLRPRRPGLLQGPWRVAAGAACAANGVLILLPIPFGNLPPSLAVILLAQGIAAADGLAVLAGLAITLMALAVDLAILLGGIEVIMLAWSWM
jgi:hypothetical protein